VWDYFSKFQELLPNQVQLTNRMCSKLCSVYMWSLHITHRVPLNSWILLSILWRIPYRWEDCMRPYVKS
jgi:hypothetical protein